MNKILVVDDDPIIGEMLNFMLGSKGYKAVISNQPEQTVQKILHNGIELIMLDQFIFGVSGIEVCKELQENDTTAHIPILMMSAQNDIKIKCLTAGAADFISKPFEMKTLFSKIENLLKYTKV